MTLVVRSYVGNGLRQTIKIGFKPALVISLAANANESAFKIDDLWAGRSNSFAAIDSYQNGAKFYDQGFIVSASSKWNAKGVVYHFMAFAKSDGLGIAFAGIQGNQQPGRAVKLDDATLTPLAVLAKRDNVRDGVLKIGANETALLGGTAATAAGAITGLTVGGFTISNSVYVNEYNPGSEIGEGMDFIAFAAGPNVAAQSWTGNGALRTIALPFQPDAAFLVKLTGSVLSGRIKTSTMGLSELKPASGVAASAQGVRFVPAGLEIDASSPMNAAGESYAVLAFKAHNDLPIAVPAIARSGRKAIYMLARAANSYVDCGVNAAMAIDGAISLEWFGSIEPVGRSSPVPLLWRGSATTTAAATCSFALYANGYLGNPGTWAGPMLSVGCTDRIDLSMTSADIQKQWRTGLLLDYGALTHLLTTHDGFGGWSFYINGHLVRQRKIDLSAEVSLPNIDGDPTHRMLLGSMYNAATPTNARNRQYMVSSRVSDVELTAAEVASRFARRVLGSSETDVTRGLVEEWDADNASGLLLPGTINSANNGTLVNCEIVTL